MWWPPAAPGQRKMLGVDIQNSKERQRSQQNLLSRTRQSKVHAIRLRGPTEVGPLLDTAVPFPTRVPYVPRGFVGAALLLSSAALLFVHIIESILPPRISTGTRGSPSMVES